MKPLRVIEKYADFASASRRAKELAINLHELTGIERSSGGWAVLASSTICSAVAEKAHAFAVEAKPVSANIPNKVVEPRYKPGEYPPDNFSQIVTKNLYGYLTDCDPEEYWDTYGTRAYDPSTGDCNVGIMGKSD